MSLIDAVVPAIAIIYAMTAAVSHRIAVRAARFVLPLLGVGCALQLLVEEFYWQFVPTYVVIVATSLLVLAPWGARAQQRTTGALAESNERLLAEVGAHEPGATVTYGAAEEDSTPVQRSAAEPETTDEPLPNTGARRRRLMVGARIVVGVLAAIAIVPWGFAPVPSLPEPTGPYAVGTQIFRWVDQERPEAATESVSDRRNVIVQAWYPAEPGSGRQYVYLDGADQLPSRVTVIPGFIMSSYWAIDTHATAHLPVNEERPRWPVVLFSPGYGAPRAVYTGLVVDLASRGFVVLTIDHPYEVAVTELADGTIATANTPTFDNDSEGDRYMSEQQQVRAADLRFVVDQLARPETLGLLADRIDTEHIAAIGHSFGGAAAVAAAASDTRIKAAANIDGTLYGDLPAQSLTRPFLLLESDHSETGHSTQYLDGNRILITHLRAGGFRYQIAEANHYSFTDAPRYLTAPARFALAQVIGGSRGPQETQRAANNILAAFLQEPLGGPTADVPSAATSYPNITGGPLG